MSKRLSKTRDICDIYERSNEANFNLEELYCLQMDYGPFNFEEVVKDKRWRCAMDKEINSIKKNDT